MRESLNIWKLCIGCSGEWQILVTLSLLVYILLGWRLGGVPVPAVQVVNLEKFPGRKSAVWMNEIVNGSRQ